MSSAPPPFVASENFNIVLNTCIIGSSGDLVHDIWIEDTDNHGKQGDVYRYIDNVEVERGAQHLRLFVRALTAKSLKALGVAIAV